MEHGEAPYTACIWGHDAVVLRLIISMARETKGQCQRREGERKRVCLHGLGP